MMVSFEAKVEEKREQVNIQTEKYCSDRVKLGEYSKIEVLAKNIKSLCEEFLF